MSRLQLALTVSNLEESIEFYSKFFKPGLAKVRPGYVNLAFAEPPLKWVFFENREVLGTINHLGVEVFSTTEVVHATRCLASEGFDTDIEEGALCCHALQDKVWVDGPDGSCWEVHTVLADASEVPCLVGDETRGPTGPLTTNTTKTTPCC